VEWMGMVVGECRDVITDTGEHKRA
jgi:hypothetical protein